MVNIVDDGLDCHGKCKAQKLLFTYFIKYPNLSSLKIQFLFSLFVFAVLENQMSTSGHFCKIADFVRDLE